jgi:outer membrane protein assembly factor BamB
LLLLGALLLALHALYPGGGMVQRSPGSIGTAIATSTTAPTRAPAAATRFRYTGARIYALDNAGLSVWNTAVDAQVTRLTVAAGRVYAYTASGATYILQASSGQILTRQAQQPTAAPKKDGGDGKHGKGGGGGGGDNGD